MSKSGGVSRQLEKGHSNLLCMHILGSFVKSSFQKKVFNTHPGELGSSTHRRLAQRMIHKFPWLSASRCHMAFLMRDHIVKMDQKPFRQKDRDRILKVRP